MTTHVVNRRSLDVGELVRLVHGEPVVRWDGDRTEYTCSWRSLEITDSTDYLLPKGRFDTELWVDGNGDVWRRKVIPTAWPCEPGFDHLVGAAADGITLCWHCSQPSSALEPVEFFVLLSAAGFPAEPPRSPTADGRPTARPQQRAEVEEFAGELLRVGSVEARARAARVAEPTREGGCPGMLLALTVLGCLIVGTIGRIVYGLMFQ